MHPGISVLRPPGINAIRKFCSHGQNLCRPLATKSERTPRQHDSRYCVRQHRASRRPRGHERHISRGISDSSGQRSMSGVARSSLYRNCWRRSWSRSATDPIVHCRNPRAGSSRCRRSRPELRTPCRQARTSAVTCDPLGGNATHLRSADVAIAGGECDGVLRVGPPASRRERRAILPPRRAKRPPAQALAVAVSFATVAARAIEPLSATLGQPSRIARRFAESLPR